MTSIDTIYCLAYPETLPMSCYLNQDMVIRGRLSMGRKQRYYEHILYPSTTAYPSSEVLKTLHYRPNFEDGVQKF